MWQSKLDFKKWWSNLKNMIIRIIKKISIKDIQSATLVILMGSMIVLVLYIIFNTDSHTTRNNNYIDMANKRIDTIICNAYNTRLAENQYILVNQNTQDTISVKEQNEYLLINKDDLVYVLKQHITDHSNIMDANNYLAIILTLITLCVTLAAVIPYIMGKSILEKDIKDTLEKMEHKESVKYRNLVDQLERAEAHLSRMTAYNLMIEYKQERCKSNIGEKVLNLSIHPYWVVGWSSKAIIRYQKCTSKGFATDKFMDNCAEYIKEASKDIINSNITNDKDGIMLRAFVDLYDVIQLNNIYRPIEFQKNISELGCILCQLWVMLKKCYEQEGTNVEDTLFDLIKQKTKRNEYLASDATDDDVRKKFNEWKSTCRDNQVQA